MAARLLRSWDVFPPWHVAVNEGRTRWIALRRRRAEPVVLLSPLVIVTLVSASGWGLTRFRHAAEAAIVVLAAVALVEPGRRLPARRPLPSSPRRAAA